VTAAARPPIDRARDVLAAQIEAEWPGWAVSHGVMGWAAVWIDDPACRVRAESTPALKATLPKPGKPPPGAG
jgi:hypothetical protein